MKRFILVALTLPVFLVGCGAPVESEYDKPKPEPKPYSKAVGKEYSEMDLGWGKNVYKFTLQDKECIVFSGDKTSAMQCWEVPK